MPITYRRLLPTDIPQYRAVRLECLREHPHNFGANYAEQSRLPKLWMETQIELGSNEAFVYGAFDEEQLIGICGLTRDGIEARRHVATVIQMYVQEPYTGRGIGQGLLQALMDAAWQIPELEQLVLDVVTSSQSAIYLYGKLGFEQYGFHKDHLKFGDDYQDALMMVRFRGNAE